jgi:hypothetical protein
MQTSGNPCSCSHLILDKGVKINIGEKTTSLTNCAGKTEYSWVEE